MTDTPAPLLVAALVGRPNSGKSSLFNRVTGASAHVGNFPGVTVDLLEAEVVLPGGAQALLVDLPGLYSLDPGLDVSTDERIARDFLRTRRESGEPVVIVQIVDATQLSLGLRLTREIQRVEPGLPLLLIATQIDTLRADGATLDEAQLAASLGVRVLATSARDEGARAQVLGAIEQAAQAARKAPPAAPPAWEPDEVAARVVSRPPPRRDQKTAQERSERIDAWVLHPVLGPVFFVLIMGVTFAAVFLIADPAKDLVDGVLQWVGGHVRPALGGGKPASLVVDGMLGGVGTVASFLPQILVLIGALEVLEASGYLARAAFLVDRVFRAAGIGGKAFVPLLTAHACAVPAIAATRVLRTGLYLFGMTAGLLAARLLRQTITRGRSLPLALEMPTYKRPLLGAIARRCGLEAIDFIRKTGTVILGVSLVLWALLSLPVRPDTTGQTPVIERSAAAAIGRAFEPITRPIGFDWRINIGLIGSFGARELMVGTMGVIFGVENATEEPAPLVDKIREARAPDGSRAYSTATGLSLLVFFVLACQCMSTLSAVRRETKSWKMTGFVLGYTYSLAYLASLLVFQIARALGG
jgi:ferrous iron transport protein B